MGESHQRHDISDAAWALLEPRLLGRKGVWGGIAHDNWRFINAVCWILRTGAPWRDLPPSYGGWKNTHRRFCRWRDNGAWEALLEQLIDDPDYEWLNKRGLNTKLHLAVDAFGMPLRAIVTQGTTADCTQAAQLIEGLAPSICWPTRVTTVMPSSSKPPLKA